MRLLIRQPLTGDAAHHGFHPHPVGEAQLDPMVVAEIELGEVAVEVLLAAVLVDAAHAALEDREHALDGVGVDDAPDVLAGRVLHRLVGGKLGADLGVEPALIGVQGGLAVDVLGDDLGDMLAVGNGNVEAADAAATLDQRDDGALVGGARLAALGVGAALALLGRASFLDRAIVGLVSLNDAAVAAHRGQQAAVAHGLAQPVRHEPCGLVADIKRAVELVCAHALLARRHHVEAHQPLVQGDVAALHDGAGGDGEVLTALGVAAAVTARTLCGVNALRLAAPMADRAVRPQDRLESRPSGFGGLELGGGESVHGVLSARTLPLAYVVSTG